MKPTKKGMSLAVLLVSGLMLAPIAQAKVSMSSIKQSAQSLLDKTQKKAGSTYENIKSSFEKSSAKVNEVWDGFSPTTKAALIALIATTGAGIAAGAGYAATGGDISVGDLSTSEKKHLEGVWDSMSNAEKNNIFKVIGGQLKSLKSLKSTKF